jgi:hypothetical protein
MCVERFLRWLFKAEGVEVDVDELDWEILAGMGSGAEEGLEASGIETFAEAVGACAVLQNVVAASGAKYRVDDLVCFLCLSQHKETEPNTDIPAPALPVSVKTILDLDVPAQALQAQDLAAPAKAVSLRFKKISWYRRGRRRGTSWHRRGRRRCVAKPSRLQLHPSVSFWRLSKTLFCRGIALAQRFLFVNVVAPCTATGFS